LKRDFPGGTIFHRGTDFKMHILHMGQFIMRQQAEHDSKLPGAAERVQSFKDFPPRQKPASFNLDRVLEKMQEATDGSLH